MRAAGLGWGAEAGSSEGLDLAPLFPRQPSELWLDPLGGTRVLWLSQACPLEGGMWEGEPVPARGLSVRKHEESLKFWKVV